MLQVLFLDDDTYRHRVFKQNNPGCKHVYTAQQCIKALDSQDWDVVFLDHDLGEKHYVDPGKENTGSAVVRWIRKNQPKVGQFVVHSYNTTAGNRMNSDLKDMGYISQYAPFGPGVVECLSSLQS